MSEWLLLHSPWSFIGLAYAAFALGLLVDGLQPVLKERTLLRQLRAESKRRKDP
jgi:heme exporter protein D